MTMTKFMLKIKTSFESYKRYIYIQKNTIIITVKINNKMEEQQYHKYINNNQIQVFFSTWLHSDMVIVSVYFINAECL